ncbi:MAG: flagellar filament capping protein FliD [Defluviitaleaceae bacterium]|nr:flagellar filament capping protein FliD [Defluviitaleaceae bacterium]
MFTNQLRFNGFSGIDVNTMVTQMMRAESIRLDRLHQRRSRLTWQQDALQNVASQMQQLQRRHFDMLNPNNMLFSSTFFGLNVNQTMNGAATNAANITATSSAQAGNMRMSVNQIASADTFTFSMGQNLSGTRAEGAQFFTGDTFNVQVDNGTARTVTITSEIAAALNRTGAWASEPPADADAAAQTLLNNQLRDLFGTNTTTTEPHFVSFVISGNNITLDVEQGHTATLTAGANGGLRPNTTRNLGTFGDVNWNANNIAATRNHLRGAGFNVNGVDVRLSDTVINGINNTSQLTAALNSALYEAGVEGVRFNMHLPTGQTVQTQVLQMVFTGTEAVTISDTAGAGAVGGGLLQGLNRGEPVGGLPWRMSTVLVDMGFTSGQSSRMDTSRNVREVFGDGLFSPANAIPPGTTPPTTPPGTTPPNWHVFQINGSNVFFHEGMTVAQFQSAIAGTGQANLVFDNIRGEFALTSTSTGQEGRLSITNAATPAADRHDANASRNALVGVFGMSNPADIERRIGVNAEVVIHDMQGRRHEIARSTNFFNFEGLEIRLNSTTNTYNAAGGITGTGEIMINVQRDTARPMESIREFVESYNNLFNEMRTMFNTPRARVPGSRFQFYEPLTTEQRREMSESEIRDWEEQARRGILHREPILREMMDLMRREMFRPVQLENGENIALFQIGITFNREGEMQIDEERLRHALENRADDVAQLFTRRPDGMRTESNLPMRMATGGISERLNDIINHYTFGTSGRLVQLAGRPEHITQNQMLSRIQAMDANIERMNQVLIRRENMHFARFAAMEQAVMRSNQQIEMLWSSMGM